MADLLVWIARRIVDDADAVSVDTVVRGDVLVYRLHVAASDVGRIVGRQGRFARALRTIVRAGGVREGRPLALEIAGE